MFPTMSPSPWEGRPEAGEGELTFTIAVGTSPSPRFARPSQREGDECPLSRAQPWNALLLRLRLASAFEL